MVDSELILKYFPELNQDQQLMFVRLRALYEHWNSQINVISRKDLDNFYERHVLHSLAIAKVINFLPGTKVLDVGTGGGFPGIPLAIMFPECHFYLVDSIGKKIKVVQEVSKSLDLKNVTPLNQRAEKIPDKFHFVVSRAVAPFPEFYGWVRNKISVEQFNELKNGILYLKGGDLREEFGSLYERCVFYEIKDFFPEAFFETKKVVYMPV